MSTSMHDTSSSDLSAATQTIATASGVVMESTDKSVMYTLPGGLSEETKAQIMGAARDKLDELITAAMGDAVTTTTPLVVPDRPSWSRPALDVTDLDNEDPRDDLVWVKGIVDEWVVEEPSDSFPDKVLRRGCTVYLEGVRHLAGPELDWPDVVRVDLASDGTEGDTIQGPEDVRRLATALARAADLLEGKE